ncbi:PH domain-containing protein [Verrucomicrobiota bacterium sgz303538]
MCRIYKAPWGWALRITSTLGAVVCIGAAVLLLIHGPSHRTPPPAFLLVVPFLLVAGCALFTIREYQVEDHALLIRRLFWTTRIPLSGLLSAAVEPKAMRGSIRLCGNGGLFSFTGWYWNRHLGRFRAFATDLRQTVVLRFADDRTMVLSPDNPEAFVHEFNGCVVNA